MSPVMAEVGVETPRLNLHPEMVGASRNPNRSRRRGTTRASPCHAPPQPRSTAGRGITYG
ncbi:MAG: hypothetical protein QN160_10090 [Armatimonadota bacterium]|nr:hypothetical protein [Armatimonadota bacterium]